MATKKQKKVLGGSSSGTKKNAKAKKPNAKSIISADVGTMWVQMEKQSNGKCLIKVGLDEYGANNYLSDLLCHLRYDYGVDIDLTRLIHDDYCEDYVDSFDAIHKWCKDNTDWVDA